MRALWISLLVCIASCQMAVQSAFVKMESMIKRDSFVLASRAEPSLHHEIVFSIKQRNIEELEKILLDRSTPGTLNYQKWLTFEEVGRMTSNEHASNAIMHWINSKPDSKITWISTRKEYIKATAPIAVWETAFNTTFFKWNDLSPHSKYKDFIIRAEEYSLPEELVEHLHAVFNTVQTPPVRISFFFYP